jgi:hypothetical protein
MMSFLKLKNNGEPCTSRGVSTVRREDWTNLPSKDGKAVLSYSTVYIMPRLQKTKMAMKPMEYLRCWQKQ